MGKTIRDYSDLPRMKVVSKNRRVDVPHSVDDYIEDIVHLDRDEMIHDLLAEDDYSDIQDFY